MLPGPNIVIACPKCGALAQYGTLLSGNTFGARVWSDGKPDAPMMPRPPQFVHCHGCGRVYALGDAREIGKADWNGKSDNPEWAAAPLVAEPDESAYYDAIALCPADDAATLEKLRFFAWWRHNDAYRGDGPPAVGASADPRWRDNAEAFFATLGDSTEERFVGVELLRQLGRRAEALGRLNSIEDYEDIKAALRALCESGDTQVRELKFSNL